MSETTLKEGFVDLQKWGHYKYQFCYVNGGGHNDPEIYNWCLHNIESIMGWHMLWHGVIIYEEIDAMAFKLRWA